MQRKIKRTSKHQNCAIILPIFFFFICQFDFESNWILAKNGKLVAPLPAVSIRFEFDPRMKERPYRVFLKKEKEFFKILEYNDLNRVQFIQSSKMTYDFYNIKPGKYWVGITLNYLHKDGRVIEWEFVKPEIFTEGSKDTRNRIKIKKNKSVIVNFKILLSLEKRPKQAEHAEYFKIKKSTKAKSPEEEIMFDENYFPSGMAGFENVRRSISKNNDRYDILFLIDGFDDYLFKDTISKEPKKMMMTLECIYTGIYMQKKM